MPSVVWEMPRKAAPSNTELVIVSTSKGVAEAERLERELASYRSGGPSGSSGSANPSRASSRSAK